MSQEERDRIARENGYIDDNQYQRAQNAIRDKLLKSSRGYSNSSWSLEGMLFGLVIVLAIPLLILAAIAYFVSVYWPYLVVAGVAWAAFCMYRKLSDERKRRIKEYIVSNKPQAAAMACSAVLLIGIFLHVTTNNVVVSSGAKGQQNIPAATASNDNPSAAVNPEKQQEIKILGLGTPKMVYSQMKKPAVGQLELKNGDSLKVTANKDELTISSGDDSKVYYQCKVNAPGMPGANIPFEITEIQLSSDDWQAWAICARSGGTSPINHGYWLIGRSKDGEIKEFVSPGTLKQQGIPLLDANQKGHLIRLKYENDTLVWSYLHEDWPDGVPHAKAKLVVDKQGPVVWDNSSQGLVFKQ